ncbi:MAG TPA: hypothetical protein VH482_05505 [Thermomicrobiales bacterium]|jgi:hypothetical protein
MSGIDDFCDGPAGPFRLTLRGARATVVGTRADVLAILEVMTDEDRQHVLVESGLGTEDGAYVYDALRTQCGEDR